MRVLVCKQNKAIPGKSGQQSAQQGSTRARGGTLDSAGTRAGAPRALLAGRARARIEVIPLCLQRSVLTASPGG